ncbi:ABC transporter ATP-binding protein [Rhodovibrionaceae bacterium A322]
MSMSHGKKNFSPVETPLLSVEDLVVTLPTPKGPARILDGVSFDLQPGERLGIVGESGCGKSMTALAMMGLLPEAAQAEGRLAFQNDNLLTYSEKQWCGLRGRRIGMVFQEPMTALNPVKSIGQQVAEGLRLHLGLSKAQSEGRARQLLARVGLPEPRFSLNLFPHQLSGGQRQRVVIAIALACGPDLLIADEPTTALDVTLQAQILALLQEVAAEEGMGLVLITHDLGVVAQSTERMLVMYSGRVVESGTTKEVFARMAHPYTRGLFASLPQEPGVSGQEDLSEKPADKVPSDIEPKVTGRRRPRLKTIPGLVPDPLSRPPGCAFADRCAVVQDTCRKQPIIRAFDPEAPGHQVACHHPHVPVQKRPGEGR